MARLYDLIDSSHIGPQQLSDGLIESHRQINLRSNDMTIESPDSRCIIDGGGGGHQVFFAGQGLKQKNLTFRNLHFRYVRRAIVCDGRMGRIENVTVDNCIFEHIHDNQGTDDNDDGSIFLNEVDGAIIKNCLFVYGANGPRDHELYATYSCRGVQFKDNVVISCRDMAQIRGTDTVVSGNIGYANHIGLDLYGGTNLGPDPIRYVVENNLIIRPYGWGIRSNKMTEDSAIRNNIIIHPILSLNREGNDLLRIERGIQLPKSYGNLQSGFRDGYNGFSAASIPMVPLGADGIWKLVDTWGHDSVMAKLREYLLDQREDMLYVLNKKDPDLIVNDGPIQGLDRRISALERWREEMDGTR